MLQGLHCPFETSAHQPVTANSSISPPPHSCAGHNCLTALCLRYMPLHSLHYASGLRFISTSFHYDPFAPSRSSSGTNLGTHAIVIPSLHFVKSLPLLFPAQFRGMPCVSRSIHRYLYIAKTLTTLHAHPESNFLFSFFRFFFLLCENNILLNYVHKKTRKQELLSAEPGSFHSFP